MNLYAIFLSLFIFFNYSIGQTFAGCSEYLKPGEFNRFYEIKLLKKKYKESHSLFKEQDLNKILSNEENLATLSKKLGNDNDDLLALFENFLLTTTAQSRVELINRYSYDGALGFYRNQDGQIEFLNINVPRAYSYAMEYFSKDFLDTISIDLSMIKKIHSKATQYYIKDGFFLERSSQYTNRRRVRLKKSEAHPEVLKRAEDFGFKVVNTSDKYVHIYKYQEGKPPPNYDKILKQLIAETNNKLMHAADNIERLFVMVSFYQDFMLIHPFDDGNGRTMRVLMQAFIDSNYDFSSLPILFHRELGYSKREFGQSLIKQYQKQSYNNPVVNIAILKLILARENEIGNQIYQTRKISVTPHVSSIYNQPFQSFKIRDLIVSNDPELKGDLQYLSLAKNIISVDEQVYYARPIYANHNMPRLVRNIFQYGRTTSRESWQALADLWSYLVADSSYEVRDTGFFPSSLKFEKALDFAVGSNRYHIGALVFVIDPKGAQVFNVDNFSYSIENLSEELQKKIFRHESDFGYFPGGEAEVVFSGSIPPQRFIGAYYVGKEGIIYFKNENYKPQP